MRYNPIPKTDEDLADYRGSIVHLAPATTYEVQLTLAGTSTTATLTATTWSEEFPGRRDGPRGRPRHAAGDHRVGHARGLPGLRRPRRDDRRAPPARLVHHDQRLLRDPPRLHAQGRRRGRQHARESRSAPSGSRAATTSSSRTATSPTGAGSIPRPVSAFDYDAAIFSRSTSAEAAHRPALQAAPSDLRRQHLVRAEVSRRTRMGPQCITLFNTAGNHVIRYNECFSDLEHMYNDMHRRRQQRQLPRLARPRLGHLRQPRQPLLGRRPGGGRRQPQRARLGQLHHAVP